jgi:lysophospholipase L1-like esterase
VTVDTRQATELRLSIGRRVALALAPILCLVAATVARDASAAPSTHSVIIIGDSIINGNKPGVEAALAAADIPNWHINSRSGRMITTSTVINGSTVSSGLSAVDQVRAAGYESDFWVVELGTNNLGMIRNCACPDKVAFARNLIEQMRTKIGVERRTAWVNVRANTMLAESIIFNDALRQVAAENANFTLIDWYTLSAGHSNWFIDGVHPTITGVGYFSNLLASSIETILPTVTSTTTTTTTTTSPIPISAVDFPAAATEVATRITTTTQPAPSTSIAPTPAQLCGTISSTVTSTSTTTRVKTVQCALKLAGFNPGPVDGIYGTQTRNAVNAFQSARGITVTGTVNQATGVALGIWI